MFKPTTENRPGHHATLRQSVDNPVQVERLPEGRSLSLEHRTRLASAVERRALHIYFAWQIAWRLALLVIGKVLSDWQYAVANWYYAILILLGLVSCSRGLLVHRSASARWFAYLFVCPLAAAPAFLFDRPYYDLSLGFVALALLGDRLATHHFFALTAGLRPRRRQWLRLCWRNRFNLLEGVGRRIAFYGLAAATPLLVLLLILYRRQEPVRYLYTDDLYILGPAVGIALVAALLFEPLVNFLYHQPVKHPFRNVSAQLKMAGSHLAAIVTRLGSSEALNVRPGPDVSQELLDSAIDMREPFEEPQVLYFHLSSALGTATSAEIARMAMFSLLSASKFAEGKRRQVFLIVDEFQRAVSNNLELFLQTARSMSIVVILANQSLSDLR